MISAPLHNLFPHVPFKNSYRVPEVENILGISRTSLYRAIESGEIQTLRFRDRIVIIPGVELRKFIDSHLTQPWFD